MTRWQKSINEGRCKEMKSRAATEGKNESVASNDCRAKTYLNEVSFDAIENEAERNYLKDLPTSFHIEPEGVDRLIKAARQILQESDEFHALIESLK